MSNCELKDERHSFELNIVFGFGISIYKCSKCGMTLFGRKGLENPDSEELSQNLKLQVGMSEYISAYLD